MATVRARIDAAFGTLGRVIFRNRLKTLLIVLVGAAALLSQIPHIKFDTSTESFFRADDPALINYNLFRDQFGRDEVIVVAIQPPEVFDHDFLVRLRDLHHALEKEVPHLKEVTSLINVRDTRGERDTLVVEDLLKEIPTSPRALAALRERVLKSELYPNLIISEDGRFTTVVVETVAFSDAGQQDPLSAGFGGSPLQVGTAPAAAPRQLLTDEENSEVVHVVERVVARFDAPNFPVHLAGSPIVTDYLKRAMQSNMARFMSLAILTIGVLLGLLFRRVSGVLLPLLVVLLSVVTTVGAMAALGVSFKLPLMILPSFLVAVGVGTVVHLLAIFYRNYEQGLSKEQALVDALSHTGLPIVMTSITTAAGLFSFVTAALGAVADLGMFASLGVLIALVYSLVLVPALLALLPMRRHARFAKQAQARTPLADRILLGVGNFATRKPGLVVAVSAALAITAAAGLPWLHFSHNTLRWFPESGTIRQNTELIDHELKGSLSVEVVVDTGHENGLYEPAVLTRLDELAAYAKDYRDRNGKHFVGKTNSVSDVVKEINRALHENRQAYYRLPDNRDLIAQELLLFENSGSDDLQRQVDSQFSRARLSIRTPWNDAAFYVNFVEDLEQKGHAIFGNDAKVVVTGVIRLFTESINALMRSMITSYSVAIAVITILMILLIGRFRLGLLSMIPNLLPILITLGFMGWAGIALDAFTLLIGSISLGLAVDDTIHFFHHFNRFYSRTGDAREAVRETLMTSGRAMLFTTLVLTTGFWLFMFATLNNLYYFGLLTGMTLLLALAADLLLAPAMLTLLSRFEMGRARH